MDPALLCGRRQVVDDVDDDRVALEGEHDRRVDDPAHQPFGPLTGLSSDEAGARLSRDGPNVVVPEARASRWKRLAGPLGDPMVALLLVAAPTYLLIGETTDAIVALAALGPVAAVGWLLEARAERTLEQLRRMTASTPTVTRDGGSPWWQRHRRRCGWSR